MRPPPRLFFLMLRLPPSSTLFPYTTLFRSLAQYAGFQEFKQTISASKYSSDSFKLDRKSTRLNSSHTVISYAVFCLKKKNQQQPTEVKAALDRPARHARVKPSLDRQVSARC